MGMLATGSGGIVGFILGLVGGGGSILAVPLLIYGVGISSAHVAIGTSAVAVSASALANLVSHWRSGNVKWPCALVFALAGVFGATVGATIAKSLDGEKLLALFGLTMIVVGAAMLWNRSSGGDPGVRLSRETARELVPRLLTI